MKTDVIAVGIVTDKAVKAVNDDGQTVTAETVLAKLDEVSAHSVDLRFDRVLTPDEMAAVTEAALAEFSLLEVEREAEPHVIHQAKAIDKSEANGLRYVGMIDCPDCTRGLASRGGVMVCVQAGRFDTSKLKEGDVVACGRPRA